jgi:23S rRNA pseudouridine2605 synthase
MSRRLNQAVAATGYCSRREADALILQGHVAVNGTVVRELSTRVEASDQLHVRGRLMTIPEGSLYAVYKPAGVLSTHRDPGGRPTLFQRLPRLLGEYHLVGRLDAASEGLLLLTNVPAWKHVLEDPESALPRKYRVRVQGEVPRGMTEALAAGYVHEGWHYRPVVCRMIDPERQRERTHHWLEWVLYEGKNREIRRLCDAFGLSVLRLIRTAYGPVELGALKPGQFEAISGEWCRALCGPDTKSE